MSIRRFSAPGVRFPLMVGIILRLVMMFQVNAPWGDNGAAVLDVAKNLLSGRGYTTQRIWTFYGPAREFGQPEGNRQPLLPVLETGVRAMAGPSFRAAQSIPLLFGLVAILLSFLLASLLGGPVAGSLAAWFAALDPLQIYFTAQIEDQILFLVFVLSLGVWLASKPHERPGGSPFVPALLLALMYLTRANGLLFLVSYVGLCVWKKELRHVRGVVLLFLLFSSPWLVRNIRAFGNPFHTDNAYFLWNDEFWQVFSVRPTAPNALEYISTHSLWHIIGRWIKGAYLCLEGFFLGNIFKDEPFARGALTIPMLLAAWGFSKSKMSWLLRFFGLALLLHFLSLSWHAHGTHRYFLPFYAFILIGAAVGLKAAWTTWVSPLPKSGKIYVLLFASCVLLFPLIRPLAHTLGRSDKAIHDEAQQVVFWLQEEAGKKTVLMDFPIIEKYLYLYDLPTVMMPYGTLEEIWSVAKAYQATHLVVCPDQVRLIPALGAHWQVCNGELVEAGIPPFLVPVMSSSKGMFRVYAFHWERACDLPHEESSP